MVSCGRARLFARKGRSRRGRKEEKLVGGFMVKGFLLSLREKTADGLLADFIHVWCVCLGRDSYARPYL